MWVRLPLLPQLESRQMLVCCACLLSKSSTFEARVRFPYSPQQYGTVVYQAKIAGLQPAERSASLRGSTKRYRSSMVEQSAVNRQAIGSSPIGIAKTRWPKG